MKRIRCPKCENYLTFDETKYTEGQSLVFVCDQCKKQFSSRLGKSKMKAPQKEERPDEAEFKEAFVLRCTGGNCQWQAGYSAVLGGQLHVEV